MVLPDPDGDGWHLFVTARSVAAGRNDDGVVAHATSQDLATWTLGPPLCDPGAGFGQLEVLQNVVVAGRPALAFTCHPQEQTAERIAEWGEYCTWSVPSPGVLGPWDMSKARPFLPEPDLFAAPIVRLRDGGSAIIGFRNLEPRAVTGSRSSTRSPSPSTPRATWWRASRYAGWRAAAASRSSAPNAWGSTSAIGELALGSEQHAYRTAVLPQQLAAPTARHEQLAVAADADDRDEPPPAGAVQVGDHPALGAEPDAVGGVLDVAPRTRRGRRRRARPPRPGTGSTGRMRAPSPRRAAACSAGQSVTSPHPCGRSARRRPVVAAVARRRPGRAASRRRASCR